MAASGLTVQKYAQTQLFGKIIEGLLGKEALYLCTCLPSLLPLPVSLPWTLQPETVVF